MLSRIIRLPNHSFLLLGARGVGKSTLLKQTYPKEQSLWIDLLDLELGDYYTNQPNALYEIVHALPQSITHVVIDEVQKIPKLLDVVHRLIESTDKFFVLTGSSSRKLKRGGANLLAGRVLHYQLFPLTFLELGVSFDLSFALQWGMMPKIHHLKSAEEKSQFLKTYAQLYLKEEIFAEQLIRHLPPFRKFLEVAAQMNGKIINYANIARDVHVDVKTVQNYFSILEDTYLGFFLEAAHTSVRKRVHASPKFYFFDVGVVRALARMLEVPVQTGNSYYGELFEAFVIIEIFKTMHYSQKNYHLSYLRTKEDVEIDLLVERPGQKTLCIEIKSKTMVSALDFTSFKKVAMDIGECEIICLCQEKMPRQLDSVLILPWQEGIKRYFA